MTFISLMVKLEIYFNAYIKELRRRYKYLHNFYDYFDFTNSTSIFNSLGPFTVALCEDLF